jgi:hypothetical protein
MKRRKHGVSSASRGRAILLIAKTFIVTFVGLHFVIPNKN